MADISKINIPGRGEYNIKDTTARERIPTKTSDLTNDSGFITSSYHDETKLNTSLKGANNGLAELDGNGKVLSAQLPSYVDDVLEYSTKSSFPSVGESGKIYIDAATNITYRWSGSVYTAIGSDLALGETSSTAYRGDRGKIAYDHSQSTHAPSNAQKNVQSDWNATSGDALILNKPSIPSKTSDLTNDVGFITEGGAIVYFSESEPTNAKDGDIWATQEEIGVVEMTMNKVSAISKYSTDTQYPSAKCVYDLIGDITSLLDSL